MNAVVLIEKGNLEYKEVSDLEETQDKQVVQIKYSALNHRDVWISKGMYPGIQYPTILGSDGAGILNGKPVIINPSNQWGRSASFQGEQYHILGLPTNGTFAEQVLVGREKVFPKPEHLSLESASALPLAGLTAYRVLFSRCKLVKGERVLISGIGGGVALFAFQFALAIGAEVFVTSGSDIKIEKAIKMGAKGGVNYKEEGWNKKLSQLSTGFDVIIDSAGGEGFTNLLKLADFGARIGIYGGTQGSIPKLSPQLIFWKQISILGSTMGSDDDFVEMLDFVNNHKIVPKVDKIFDLKDAKSAFEYMDKGVQFGKIVFLNT